MSKTNGQGNSFMKAISSVFASIAILVALGVSLVVFFQVMGNPANFEGGNPDGTPLQGNLLAMMFKGGYVVPVLMTCVLTVIIFVLERFIMLAAAKGGNALRSTIFWLLFLFTAVIPAIIYWAVNRKTSTRKGNLGNFVRKVQSQIGEGKIDEAIQSCNEFKGSVANVLYSGLVKYKSLKADTVLDKDQKVLALQKELEESTALELPMLSKNLVILSTLASICVLIGLFGTVLGMIKAFAALATAGAPDALALATGISEALINTAFGIAGSCLAIIFYNYFSNKVDSMTFKIDEAGFSLIQSFAATTK